MPNLNDRPASSVVKTILAGDGGTGKTSALISLVKAGYKVRIMDFDNQLTPLVHLIRRDCPDKIANVSYLPFIDKMKMVGSMPGLDGAPTAYIEAMKALDNWPEANLGPPAKWGAESVLVLDSFSRYCDAAERWADFFMVKPGKSTGQKDYRDVIGEAQSGVTHFLNLVRAPEFNTNVILICHLSYQNTTEGGLKGYPKAPGQKLSPQVPTYFESYLLCENSPQGKIIRTQATPLIDLKNAASFEVPAIMPAQTALADFFRIVTNGAKK